MRPPTVARVTIVDVAQAAGVSVSTVSKVINDRYGVSPETYDKVMGVVEELGYESSLVASSLRRGSTNVIGILVPEFEPFSTELLKGISAAAEGTGYELLAYSGNLEHNQVGWERRSLSRLAGTLIDLESCERDIELRNKSLRAKELQMQFRIEQMQFLNTPRFYKEI